MRPFLPHKVPLWTLCWLRHSSTKFESYYVGSHDQVPFSLDKPLPDVHQMAAAYDFPNGRQVCEAVVESDFDSLLISANGTTVSFTWQGRSIHVANSGDAWAVFGSRREGRGRIEGFLDLLALR